MSKAATSWVLTFRSLACFTTPAHAARLLTATVERDGQVVLRAAYTDDSNPHRERVRREHRDRCTTLVREST
jgi:hypothetical protein